MNKCILLLQVLAYIQGADLGFTTTVPPLFGTQPWSWREEQRPTDISLPLKRGLEGNLFSYWFVFSPVSRFQEGSNQSLYFCLRPSFNLEALSFLSCTVYLRKERFSYFTPLFCWSVILHFVLWYFPSRGIQFLNTCSKLIVASLCSSRIWNWNLSAVMLPSIQPALQLSNLTVSW